METIKLQVLILVLMEDTLRGRGNETVTVSSIVLILVLMEDTLRELKMRYDYKHSYSVLILVLMEDTLRVSRV